MKPGRAVLEPVPIIVDPVHGPGFAVPDVCGSAWWGALHGVVSAINCSHCRGEAEKLMSALHDYVNWKLGKPLFNRRNFISVALWYLDALRDLGESHFQAAPTSDFPALTDEQLNGISETESQALFQAAQGGPALHFPILSDEQLEHVFAAESHLAAAGVSFDTDYDLDDRSRQWRLDWSLTGARLGD